MLLRLLARGHGKCPSLAPERAKRHRVAESFTLFARALQISVPDFVQFAASLVLVIVFGVEYGLIAAVLISFFGLVFLSFRPAFQILGRLPGTSTFVDIARFPDAQPVRARACRNCVFRDSARTFVDRRRIFTSFGSMATCTLETRLPFRRVRARAGCYNDLRFAFGFRLWRGRMHAPPVGCVNSHLQDMITSVIQKETARERAVNGDCIVPMKTPVGILAQPGDIAAPHDADECSGDDVSPPGRGPAGSVCEEMALERSMSSIETPLATPLTTTGNTSIGMRLVWRPPFIHCS